MEAKINQTPVLLTVENGHMCMFHDNKKLLGDTDAANALGLKSKHSKYFSVDLGAAPEGEVTAADFRAALAKRYKGVIEIEGETHDLFTSPAATPTPGNTFDLFSVFRENLKQELAAELRATMKPQTVTTEHVIKVADKVTKTKGKIYHAQFERICAYVNAGVPVYMFGPAGSGKNIIAQQVAEALQLDYYYINSVTQEHKLTGFTDAGGHYHETQFFQALTKGGLFFLDEADASIPEVMILINGVLSDGYAVFEGKRYDAHPNFRVIAAGNTMCNGADEDYTARYSIDAATVDRFIFIPVDYCREIENAISGNNTDLIDFVHELRRIAQSKGVKIILGYRTFNRMKLAEQLEPDTATALEYSIFNRLDTDARNLLINNLPAREGKYYKAARTLLLTA